MVQDPGFQLRGIDDIAFAATGGFSTIYRGYQTSFGRWVAVKVVHCVGDHESARRRFEREQMAMGRLSQHPNVVTVYDSGLLPNGEPYLVMDFLTNGSAAQLLAATGALPAGEARGLAADIANALAAAHQLGIVHGDLKPGNILLGANRQALLTDFGISQLIDHSTTTPGQYLTPSYAAPEQRSHGQTLPASDMWSLGATLFVLLTGVTVPQPSPDVPSDPSQDSAAVAAAMLLRAGAPGDLVALVQQCLQRDPLARPDARTVHQRLLTVPAASATAAPAGPASAGLEPGPTSASFPATRAVHSGWYGAVAPGANEIFESQPVVPVAAPADVGPTQPRGFPSGQAVAAPAGVASVPPVTAPDPPASPWRRVLVPLCLAVLVLGVGAAGAAAVLRPRPGAEGADGRPRDTTEVGLATSITAAPPLSAKSVEGQSPSAKQPAGSQPETEAPSALVGAGDQCVSEGVVDANGTVVLVGYSGSGVGDVGGACCVTSIQPQLECSRAARRYAIYRSAEGGKWTQQAPLSQSGGRGAQEFHGVIHTGDRFFAVGASWITNPNDFAATVWTSTDGQKWQSAHSWEPGSNDGLRQVATDIASNGTRVVVVGYRDVSEPAVLASAGMVLVGSADGTLWIDPPIAPPATAMHQRLFAVVWTGDVFFAGGFQAPTSNGGSKARLWRSDANGENWALAWSAQVGVYSEISALASQGTNTVGIGMRKLVDDVDGVVVLSSDGGKTWAEVETKVLHGAGYQRPVNISVIDGWFVVSGWMQDPACAPGSGSCHGAAVWASRDGRAWQQLTLSDRTKPVGPQEALSVVKVGSGWVAVGHETTASGTDARTWPVTLPSN